MNTVLRISYASEDELTRKLTIILERRGLVVVPSGPEWLTVGKLAERVGRRVNAVSRALRNPSCPQFVGEYGTGKERRRIKRLVASERLISYLTP